MANIESRLTKLEQTVRVTPERRAKQDRDAAFAAYVEHLAPFAATCTSWQQVNAHMAQMAQQHDNRSPFPEDLRRDHAVRAASARLIFDDIKGQRTKSTND